MINIKPITIEKLECYTLSQLAHIFNKDEEELMYEIDNYSFRYKGRRYYGVEDIREYIKINNIQNVHF
ncbi:MAG: hypothetical protein N4A43_02480 [Alphaproteobacteria bacterium]|jgi:hypothetical protein|nr:hypothetical protein [Alphaproteobacteria bacterium]